MADARHCRIISDNLHLFRCNWVLYGVKRVTVHYVRRVLRKIWTLEKEEKLEFSLFSFVVFAGMSVKSGRFEEWKSNIPPNFEVPSWLFTIYFTFFGWKWTKYARNDEYHCVVIVQFGDFNRIGLWIGAAMADSCIHLCSVPTELFICRAFRN